MREHDSYYVLARNEDSDTEKVTNQYIPNDSVGGMTYAQSLRQRNERLGQRHYEEDVSIFTLFVDTKNNNNKPA